MTSHKAAVGLLLLVMANSIAASADQPVNSGTATRASAPPVRVFGNTSIVGHSDPSVWQHVLDVLPVRPGRIEILDLDTLSPATRARLKGIEAFVLAGQSTIVVIRQGASLRQAELGDAADRLILASLVWHELAHVHGADEEMAFQWEQALWRRFMTAGRVDAATGLAYMSRLDEERVRVRTRPDAVFAECSAAPARQIERHDGD